MSTVKQEKEATAYKSLVAAEKAFIRMLCIAIELLEDFVDTANEDA